VAERNATPVESALNAQLGAFDEAVEILAKYSDDAEQEHVGAVRAKAHERLRHGTTHTVVAIAGATGSGKSSIVNRLAGRELTKSSVRRPTTSATHAVVWGDDDASGLLDWLEVGHRYQIDGSSSLDGLVLLDLPDHDSTAVEHQLEVDRLVELVDVLVWVTDPQKYADAALHHGYIAPLASHAPILRFVLNQVDRLDDGGRAVGEDFLRRVHEDGIAGAEVLRVSALDGTGFDEVQTMLETAVSARQAAIERVEADLREAASGLQGSAKGVVSELGSPEGRNAKDLIRGLGEAAGAEEAAGVALRHHRRQGRLAMGWPFTRFVRRLARKPLADLPGPGRAGAAAPRADLAIRDYGEAVAGEAPKRWSRAVSTAAKSGRDELLDELRSSVGRATVEAGARPLWWTPIVWLQRVFAAAAIVGLVWLVTVAILGGFFQFATEPLLPPTPEAEWMPLPSALLIGGVVLGLVLGLLVRIPLSVGAARRGRAARKAIEDRVEQHANRRVIDPVKAVVADAARVDDLLKRIGV